MRGQRHFYGVLLMGIALSLAFFGVPQPKTLAAATSQTITFQARILSKDRLNAPSGQYSFRFSIYNNATSGGALWSEQWSVDNKIQVRHGLFSTDLGSINPLSANLFTNNSLYLTVEFDSDNNGSFDQLFLSRIPLTAVPYAFSAHSLDGKTADSFVDTTSNTTVTGSWQFQGGVSIGTLNGILSASNGTLGVATTGNITGTSNQITVTGGTGAALGSGVTLALPQDIATTSTPTFASLNVNSGGTIAIGDASIYRSSSQYLQTASTFSAYRLIATHQNGSIYTNDSAQNVYALIRSYQGKNGWLAFTEDSVADRWSVGIKAGDASLHIGTGGPDAYTDRFSFIAGAFNMLAQSDLRMYDADSSNYVGFQSPATVGSDIVWTLPNADGTSGQCLSTDAAGTLSWADCAGGSGAPTTASYITLGTNGTLSAERVLTGTPDQISITDNGANGTVVLSTPQSISTASSPTFANLTDSALTSGRVTYAGIAGILQDSASMTFDTTNGLKLAAGSTSALQLTSTAGTAVGGLLFGTDTNLYRQGANILRTDDNFHLGGNLYIGYTGAETAHLVGSSNATDTAFDFRNSDGDVRWEFRDDNGVFELNKGTDTNNILTFDTSSNVHVTNSLALNSATSRLTIGQSTINTNTILYVNGTNITADDNATAASFVTNANPASGTLATLRSLDLYVGSEQNKTITTTQLLHINNPITDTGVSYGTVYGGYIDAITVGATANVGLYIADAGTYSLQLASTDGDAASGITFGTDTNLYRSAANMLKTDDSFTAKNLVVNAVAGENGIISFVEDGTEQAQVYYNPTYDVLALATGTPVVSRMIIDSDGNIGLGTLGGTYNPDVKLHIDSTGYIGWDDGAGTVDTNLYRSAENTLKTDDALLIATRLGVGTTTDADWEIYVQGDIRSYDGTIRADNGLVVAANSADLLAQADLRYYDSDSTNYVGFQAPATIESNLVWTLPSADGGAGQCLATNAGVLSWADCGGGSGAPTTSQYVALALDGTLSAERILTGTSNQITITDNGANGTVVLSTPQNIHTAASPTFAGLALGSGDLTMTGSLGLTGSRLTKGWFTDLEVSNAITGSVTGSSGSTTGNAATVTNGVYTTDTGTVTSTMLLNSTILTEDIANGAVALANMADMATASFIGRNTALTGVPEILSASTAKSILAIAQADVSGLTTASSPTFTALNLSASTNQLVLQSGGVSGTLTWTPTSSGKVITLPDATGTVAVSASSPLALSVAGALSIQNAAADGSTKGAASFAAADFDASSGNITIDYTNGTAATSGAKGFLTAADWTTFNAKLGTSTTLFTLAGTTGDNQTITSGNTVTLAAGTDITTTGGATDTVTIANSSTLATVTGRGATTTTLVNLDGGIAVDTSNFTVNGTSGAVSTASTISAGGTITIQNTAPQLTLTDTDDSNSARLARSDSSATFGIYNTVNTPGTGYAGQLTGTSNQYYDAGNPAALQLTTAISIEAWIYPTSLPFEILSKNGNSGVRFLIEDVGGTQTLRFFGNYAGGIIVDGAEVTANAWHHVAVTANASGVNLYLDGNNVGSSGSSYNGTGMGSGNLQIGAVTNYATYATGKIDNLAIYNQAIDGSVITDHYNSGAGKIIPTDTTGLVAYWPFDENTGTNAVDIKNSITATGQNTPTWGSGLAPGSGSDSEITVLTATDGVADGEAGIITLGNSSSTLNLAGSSIVAAAGGNTVLTVADPTSAASAASITAVNSASGSLNALNLSGTLGIFNGSDTFRGIYLNYTNADHTGSSNNFYGLDIAGITADAEATERAININSGWDVGMYIADGATYSLQLASTDGDAASGITFGTDTNLYRSAANTLMTDDSLTVGGRVGIGREHTAGYLLDIYTNAGEAVTLIESGKDTGWAFYQSKNDLGNNFSVGITGSAFVTYRGLVANTAAILVDSPATNFVVSSTGQQEFWTGASGAKALTIDTSQVLWIGSTADTNLYRGAANELRTDDLLSFSSIKANTATDFKTYKSDGGFGFLFDTSSTYTTGSLLSIRNNGAAKLNLSASGNLTIAGTLTQSGTPADIAENVPLSDPLITAGDIVAADPVHPGMMKKATSADYGISGVISTEPGILLSGGTSGKPLALAGRVPVKVTDANGLIHAGDVVVPSATPGFGEKAGGNTSRMVGVALSSQETATDTITVQLQIGYYSPTLGSTHTTGALSPQQQAVLGAIDLLSNNVLGISSLRVRTLAVTESLYVNGTVVFKEAPIFPTNTAGTVVIPAGQSHATVSFASPHTNIPTVTVSTVATDVASAATIAAQQYNPVVVQPTVHGFSIALSKPAVTDVQLSWIAITAAP